VVPFKWDFELDGEKIGEQKVTQTIIGVLGKYEIGQGRMRPHVRGGAGMYMGKVKFDAEEGYTAGDDIDLKSAFGFNFGGGITADWGYDKFWVAEFVYHIVSREADIEGYDTEPEGSNNWAVQLGAGMKF
jgi:hypothetical protein